MPKINTCGHPDLPYYAKGKCKSCYQNDRKKQTADRPKRLATQCPHTDRAVYAREVCRSCYQKLWKEQNWDRKDSDARYNHSEKGKERTRKYRQKKAEGYRGEHGGQI